jgi:hypothetical protein
MLHYFDVLSLKDSLTYPLLHTPCNVFKEPIRYGRQLLTDRELAARLNVTKRADGSGPPYLRLGPKRIA